MAIQGGVKTEENYRDVMLDSSSSLKDFSMDRKKYYRKYILNEDVRDKDTVAIVTGKVVETLALEAHLFDEKFYMSACASPPTGLMLDFVEALYYYTREATNDEGVITRTFEELAVDAYAKSGFKIKYEAVVAKFIGSEAEIYYREIREVRTRKLTVVTTQDITNANKIVDGLRTNFVTKDIFNLVSSDRYTILDQYQVEGYIIDEHKFKSMMDRVVIDHKSKTIQPYDLKVTWTVENFYSEYYLYRRAYIQAYLYYWACIHMKEQDENLTDYTVEAIKFIVADSTNYYNPLIYTLEKSDMLDAYNGFERNGRKYPGVKEIITDLQWAVDNDVWNMSRVNFQNDGVINIKE
jgi:hypothetical protein